jgi:hypothetical protein
MKIINGIISKTFYILLSFDTCVLTHIRILVSDPMFGLQISYGDPDFRRSPAAVGGRELARAEVLGVPNRSVRTYG